MTGETRVIGLPQLLSRFAKAALLGEVAAKAAGDELARDVADEARRIVPVDTGRLRDSITTDGGRVFTDAPYAIHVEYGTSDTPAEPFMRPAADTVDDSRALGVAAAVMRRA